jgi:hypothetical protein
MKMRRLAGAYQRNVERILDKNNESNQIEIPEIPGAADDNVNCRPVDEGTEQIESFAG